VTTDEEEVAFYFELGYATTQWAQIESGLGIALAHSVEPREGYALYVSFFSIENFRSKLQFAESMLLERYRGNPQLEQWAKLHVLLQACATKRNKLVHRQVTYYSASPAWRRFALVPWPRSELNEPAANKSRRRQEKPPSDALCLMDIQKIRLDFFAAHCAVVNFSARLRGVAEPIPKSLEQPMAPMPIRILRARIHEALGHPLPPSRRKSSLAAAQPRAKLPRHE
jgi:hypothetical protein